MQPLKLLTISKCPSQLFTEWVNNTFVLESEWWVDDMVLLLSDVTQHQRYKSVLLRGVFKPCSTMWIKLDQLCPTFGSQLITLLRLQAIEGTDHGLQPRNSQTDDSCCFQWALNIFPNSACSMLAALSHVAIAHWTMCLCRALWPRHQYHYWRPQRLFPPASTSSNVQAISLRSIQGKWSFH